MSNASATAGGIGFGGLLCIVLIVLKVLDQIHMNWFFVLTSWFWAPFLMVLTFMIFAGIGLGLFWAGALIIDKVRRK